MAGDQWNFFQAKKRRSANSTSAGKLLRNLGAVGPLTTDGITIAVAHLVQNLKSMPTGAETATALQDPLISLLADPDVKKAMEMLTVNLPPVKGLATVSVSLRRSATHPASRPSFTATDRETPGEVRHCGECFMNPTGGIRFHHSHHIRYANCGYGPRRLPVKPLFL